tara:strand:+ start:10133 stop:10513 length:381 start_codon:yes stop_codon:yes gene_type:complete
MVIQVIGLPCSGKTTALKKWFKKNTNIKYYDIVDFSESKNVKTKLSKAKHKKVLLESACGIHLNNSIVILYKQPMSKILERHKIRKETIDEDYLSLLQSNMMVPNYTVNNTKSLYNILDVLFYNKG